MENHFKMSELSTMFARKQPTSWTIQCHQSQSSHFVHKCNIQNNSYMKRTLNFSALSLSPPPPLSLSPFMRFLVTASDGWKFFFFVLCVQFHSIGQTGFLFQEIASAHYKALHLHSISMFTNALHIFLEHVTDERQHVF